MSEFHEKLLKAFEAYRLEGDATFDEWIILHAETEHKKAIQMAGDLGAALSKIGDLERAMQEFVDRCGKGEIRSTYTYEKFKKLLE